MIEQADNPEETLAVIGPATLDVIGRGGWAMISEVEKAQRWRARRVRRRRVVMASLAVAVIAGPVVVVVAVWWR